MGEARLRGTKEERIRCAIWNKAVLEKRFFITKTGQIIITETANEVAECYFCGEHFYTNEESFAIANGDSFDMCPACDDESSNAGNKE